MRKVNLVLSFLLMLALLLTSCKKAVPGGNEANTPPTDTNGGSNTSILDDKSKWNAIPGVNTNYVKLDDINPKAVPEIKIGPVIEFFGYMVKETPDGFLYGHIPSPQLSVVSAATKNIPRIRKLDRNGRLIWEKAYDYQVYSGRINNIVPYPDGSFIFSVQTSPYFRGNDMIYDKSFIIKCDKDGKELWKKDFDDYSGGMLRTIFLTGKGEIIVVGQWRTSDGKPVKDGPDHIVVTKLDKDGNVLGQKGFGGSDFDNLNIAKYEEGLGVIINGTTQSHDGDFAIGTNPNRTNADFIACIDENLDLKWVAFADGKENFIYDQLAVADRFIYVPGSFINTGESVVNGFLIKLDRDGKRVWTKTYLSSGMWGRSISILKNGDVAVGWGQQNKGVIAIFDKNGTEKKRIEDLKFAPSTITPTNDGGFITTANREIKSVPQPPVISSIWYDTELVAVKYKSDYTVEWRKTYDRYKDDRGGDFVLPLEDGKIAVEGVE